MNGETLSAADGGDETSKAIYDIIGTLGGASIGSEASLASANGAGEQTKLIDFEPYREEVLAIERLLEAGHEPNSIHGYFDIGSHVTVFTVGEGRYLAKIPHPDDGDGLEEVARMKLAFICGRGEADLAQIVTFSNEEPHAILVEPVPGDTLANINARHRLSHDTLRRHIRCYREMQLRGLATDNNASDNTILTPDSRLVTVDYEYNPDQTLEEKVLSFGSNTALLQDEESVELGGVLPQYAWKYYDVCYEEFGPELATKLKDQWRSYGYEIS